MRDCSSVTDPISGTVPHELFLRTLYNLRKSSSETIPVSVAPQLFRDLLKELFKERFLRNWFRNFLSETVTEEMFQELFLRSCSLGTVPGIVLD